MGCQVHSCYVRTNGDTESFFHSVYVFSFRLQFALLVVLVAGAVDFGFGSFTHTDPDNGFYGWNLTVWRNNSRPSYTGQHDFFSVFGVFFPGRDSFLKVRPRTLFVARLFYNTILRVSKLAPTYLPQTRTYARNLHHRSLLLTDCVFASLIECQV